MREQKDYLKELTEIRSMMERSSKFASLSGLSGILAGIYALAGTIIVSLVYGFNPDSIHYYIEPDKLINTIIAALMVLILAVATAVFLSHKKAEKGGEKIWNPTSSRLLANMSVPLISGGFLVVVFLLNDLVGLIAPATLIFYGLALFNAGKFTFEEMKFLGLFQVGLGLISSFFIEYSLLLWGLGFGVLHIIYGAYMHFKYER